MPTCEPESEHHQKEGVSKNGPEQQDPVWLASCSLTETCDDPRSHQAPAPHCIKKVEKARDGYPVEHGLPDHLSIFGLFGEPESKSSGGTEVLRVAPKNAADKVLARQSPVIEQGPTTLTLLLA